MSRRSAPARYISQQQQAVDNVSDLLSCSICMENYDDGDNQPKLLPCHHSFCKSCLIHLTNGRNFIDCPSCRQRTTLLAPPPEGVVSLQTNFYVNQMRELVAGDTSRVKTKGCRKHGHKSLSFFCKTCEIPICEECCSTDHREAMGHATQHITQAVREQKELLRVEIAAAQETIAKDQSKIKNTQAEMGSLFAANNAAESDIDEAFDHYVSILNARRKQMKEDLRKLYQYKRDGMLTSVEEIRKQAASLNGMIEQCNEAMEVGHIADLLAYKLKISSKNQETLQLAANSQPGSNFIKFDRDDPEGHVVSLLDDIGSLHSQATLPVKVKVIEQTAVACLFTSMSLFVKNSAGEDLEDYPITVDIKDIYDDEIPTLVQYRQSGHYEVTFKPCISGVHRVRVKFLNHVIVGGEFNITVQSNNTIGKIGNEGSASGEMMYPRAVAIDRFNNLYVVDTGNNRIQKFDSSGQFLVDFPISHESENYSSCGAAINNEQAVLICPEVRMHEADMAMADTILVYSLEGQLLHRLANRDHLRKALSVAVNSMGHIIIADFEYNTIFIFDRPGRLLHKFGESGSGPGQFNHPTFLCIGHDDSIIVSDGDNHRIQVFDRHGKFEYQFGGKGIDKGQFNMPFGVTTDNHGNILVVDGGNKRIQIFKYGGEFSGCIESLASKMNAPRGIAVTTDGHVLVADRDNHCVKKYRYMNCTAV